MASVDDRIVRMEFDNASFERKIASTIASISQLDKALKLTGATQGLTNVGDAAHKLNFNTISDGIENVSKKFLALSTVALTVLSNITTKAMAAGAAVAKAFTLAPIIDGFREYETQLNSVQTILANTASKGTTLDQVNDALQRLNEYSDQTIYNFGQMAKNIGTFTAAGVDLETSVSAIKGIANLAAMSGSNAEQASGAMYQLSQAIATGSLKLIDWNSVVNAGMGGEAFKTALFETGKAMGTLLDVPVDQTFKEWEASGHNFRESLQDGWITADVLTTTLAGFTGDLTEEMLIAKGYSQAVASNIVKTAAMAKAAATEVKTFTQLIGTVKEAVGTGWADSFKIIVGNFTEAKELWTGVNNSIGSFVQKNADARNALLQGWKDLGGRTLLIESLKTAFENLGKILAPIKEAFRSIFPAQTAEGLMGMTEAFSRFTAALAPSASTIEKIRSIFSGLFSVLSIGWEIIKQGTIFIIGLVKSIAGLAGPGATGFLAKLGDGLTRLQEALVKGGGIRKFFEGLTAVLQKPIALLVKVKEAIASVFDGFRSEVSDKVSGSVERISDRFSGLKAVFDRLGDLWEPFENAMSKVIAVLDGVWIAISGWFKELGQKLSKVFGPGDFNAVLDAINVGLLGGIVLLLRKFLKTGIKFDLGAGMFDKIGAAFEQMTGVLKAMQMNVKANALLKIAAAIAILTASVVVLSMIDSVALTKALTAMAVGFGQLMGTFAVFTKLAANPKTAASFTIMSAGLILLSTAILLLSGAVAILAKLSWEELARGMAALTGLLTILIVTTKPLAANSKGMIAAGVGITAMAIALTILGGAMKIFATLSWEDMAKGMIGVVGSLVGIGLAMKLFPAGPQMALIGVGLLGVAVAMTILAGAVAIFGRMKWETMGKGLLGVAGALVIIGLAMKLMPPSMPLIGLGLILVGVGLNAVALAVRSMAKMSWSEIARGMVALGASLLIIALACKGMESALPGAAAILVVSFALTMLAGVLKVIGKMSWEEIAKGLVGIAASLLIFAGVSAGLSEAIPLMLAMGVAVLVLGAGFMLLGAAVMLAGKGLESIAKAGGKAAEELPKVLEAIGKAIPSLLKGVALGILEMLQVFTDAAPIFAAAIGKLLNILIEQIIILIPKIGTAIRLLIEEIIEIIKSYVQNYIELGLFIITNLLTGIRDNIGPIVTLCADIVTEFLDAFREESPRVIESLKKTIIQWFEDTASALGEIAGSLLFGVGIKFIEGFFKGLEASLGLPEGFFKELPGKIIGWIGDAASWLWNKGWDTISGFASGIGQRFTAVQNWFLNLPNSIIGYFGNAVNWLLDAGKKIMEGLLDGIKKAWHEVEDFVGGLKDKIIGLKGPPEDDAVLLVKNGMLIMQGLQKGMEEEWTNVEKWLSNVNPADSLNPNIGTNMAKALTGALDKMSDMTDLNPVITPVLDLSLVAAGASRISGYIPSTVSLSQARTIASSQIIEAESPVGPTVPGEVKFEQNIYAPTQLSTSDIYKQTRNQITIAKEELSIP